MSRWQRKQITRHLSDCSMTFRSGTWSISFTDLKVSQYYLNNARAQTAEFIWYISKHGIGVFDLVIEYLQLNTFLKSFPALTVPCCMWLLIFFSEKKSFYIEKNTLIRQRYQIRNQPIMKQMNVRRAPPDMTCSALWCSPVYQAVANTNAHTNIITGLQRAEAITGSATCWKNQTHLSFSNLSSKQHFKWRSY